MMPQQQGMMPQQQGMMPQQQQQQMYVAPTFIAPRIYMPPPPGPLVKDTSWLSAVADAVGGHTGLYGKTTAQQTAEKQVGTGRA